MPKKDFFKKPFKPSTDPIGQLVDPAREWMEWFILRRLDDVRRYSNHPETVKQRREAMNEIPRQSYNSTGAGDFEPGVIEEGLDPLGKRPYTEKENFRRRLGVPIKDLDIDEGDYKWDPNLQKYYGQPKPTDKPDTIRRRNNPGDYWMPPEWNQLYM